MLLVENVTKEYIVKEKPGWFRKNERILRAVDNLSVHINKGEIVGLLGVNGAGKTTTIKMLSTLLEPTSGSITIDGMDVVQHAQSLRSRINMIAGGERMLYWKLTGRENLEYFGKLYGLHGKELSSRIDRLLEDVELLKAQHIPVEQYSKGMKQRLQIARGLINNPDYLFLDEPTLGLDVHVAKKLREMVYQLAKIQNKGILLTSHYLEEVEALCDRIYIIENGKLIKEGTPKQIIESLVSESKMKLSLNMKEIEKLSWESWLSKNQIHFIEEDLSNQNYEYRLTSCVDVTAKVLTYIGQKEIQIIQLETFKPSLEDAIMQMMKEVAS